MRGLAVAAWVAAVAGSPRLAQEAPTQVKPVSCSAADSAVGRPTPAQRGSRLLGYHASATDRTYLSTEGPSGDGSPVGVHVSWPGGGAPTDVTAQFTIRLPAVVLDDTPHATDSLVAMVDDTLRLVLGIPVAPRIESPVMPRFLPFTLLLDGSAFLALARAGSATFSYHGRTVRTGTRELAGVNAVWRAVSCGITVPAPG